MSVAFANAIIVAGALSSSASVPIAVFLPSLYVAPTHYHFLGSLHSNPLDATS
jgi:hypothetical protein